MGRREQNLSKPLEPLGERHRLGGEAGQGLRKEGSSGQKGDSKGQRDRQTDRIVEDVGPWWGDS